MSTGIVGQAPARHSAHAQPGHLTLSLGDADKLHLLHPGLILAYQGNPAGREDRFMDLAGLYRKRRWIRSLLAGPSRLLLGLPAGCHVHELPLEADSDLLFDFRNVLYYSDGMTMKSRIQSFKNALITQEWVRMKFTGPGKLGILTDGFLETLMLDPLIPLYVDTNALVAFPEQAALKLSVYGNTLASQHMRMQWEIKGSGPILIQTGRADRQVQQQMRQDSFIRRLLRELLPFGGVFIK